MAKNSLLYAGITIVLGILVLGGIFLTSQEDESSSSKQNVVKEEYSVNDACTFTIYKPIEGSPLTPTPNVSKEIECHFKIHKDLPEYTFQIIGVAGENNIERIQVLHEGNAEPIQTFSEFDTYPSIERAFETQDINFDGYLDIRTPAWYGTIGHTGYNYWVFNSKSEMFELEEELTGLANPKLDAKTQTITADDARVGSVRYKWKNRNLVKINGDAEVQAGHISIDLPAVESLQQEVDHGHQPWRQDPRLVAESELIRYGFTTEDLQTLSLPSYSQQDLGTSMTIIKGNIIHDKKNYLITIGQPISGKGKIWTILEVQKQ